MTSNPSIEPEPDPDEELLMFFKRREMMAVALIISEWQRMPNKPIKRSPEFHRALLDAKVKLLREVNG